MIHHVRGVVLPYRTGPDQTLKKKIKKKKGRAVVYVIHSYGIYGKMKWAPGGGDRGPTN